MFNDDDANKKINTIICGIIIAIVVTGLICAIVSLSISNSGTTAYITEFDKQSGEIWVRVKNEFNCPIYFEIVLTVTDANGVVVYSYVAPSVSLGSRQENVLLYKVRDVDKSVLANCTASIKWTSHDQYGR